jgi:hypothetical protein
MASNEASQQGGQSHLRKQDLATLVSENQAKIYFFVAWLYFLK